MYILLITHFFPPEHTEGTENYTLGLAQAFMARGHKVEVLCADSWQVGEAYWNGITQDTYQGVPVRRIHLNWTKESDPNRVLYDSLRVEGWLDQYLDTMRPDVVHVTSTYSLGVGVLRSIRRAGVPLLLTLMDFWFLCPRTVLMRGDGHLCDGITTAWECQHCLLTSSGLYRWSKSVLPSRIQPTIWDGISRAPALARLRGARGMALNVAERKALMSRALESPNVIISHSRFVQQMFYQAGLSQNVLHLANGHELSWVSNHRDKSNSSVLRIGYMGQISETKGVHLLIEAFQKVNLNGRARLDIWGDLRKDGSYTQKLKALVGSTELIALRGRFNRDQLADVLAEIDVLVVPSLWYENAPLVIQEAFATKTPVIATNLGGMAEAVTHEISGLLFERGDVDDLASQLRRILEEPGLLERLEAGIPTVKTIDEEVAELEAIYQDLIAD